MNQLNSFEQSVKLLKKCVKFSTIKGQKHIDLSVALAEERPLMQKALVIVQTEIAKGLHTEAELKKLLDLE